ncbi:hypothetical protein [Daejeonella lutea]|uniref:Uncharacterized protein n=1 Tax=Daejeonella lutea TaxID=572036 RepID=A0A1T5B7T4_9SPHI|nr:hypothetical protein [Daejeonella lutea]SKB43286.1 hypothetical protein SAMN05661099_1404 [Daejeonella lutea]
MKNSTIEITDQEYLIKVPRQEYNISFIHQLLRRIQAEQFFFRYKSEEEPEDLLSRNLDREFRFDDLRDK